MKHVICKSGFYAICKEILKCDTVYFADGTTQEAEPTITIRDFNNCNPDNTDKDVEFKNITKAWKYFSNIDKCRVMDISGNIYIDAFDDEVNKNEM